MSSIPCLPLFFLSFSILVHTILGVDPLYHICSNTFKYTTGDRYNKNLNTLLNQLTTKVPPTGFGQGSVGHSPDTVNGLALCRGDVAATDCKSCVSMASKEIRNLCPKDKGAIVWYDACLLKYSNINFLGTIDNDIKVYLYNVQNVSGNIESFNRKTKKFLSQLSEKAYKNPKLFATDETSLGGIDKLYVLVQCTRDLSSAQCKRCLDDAITELPNCCDGKRGGRVLGASCNFRYELYPFVSS